jgi:PhoPQ-activated pathogenicity-related protein
LLFAAPRAIMTESPRHHPFPGGIHSMSRFVCSALTLLVAAALFAPAPTRADVAGYAKRPDPAFSWTLKDKKETEQGTVYTIRLVSQKWHDITWEHDLQVYQPKGVAPSSTLFLWNTGGGPNPGNMLFGLDLARRIQAPTAILYHTPNQPLLGNKKEDALIAETFVRYLNTKDNSWPLLFAMVKGVVRAMDALQAFAQEEWKQPVKDFVVSGGSKRGWTSWLTAATGDARVKAIAPCVIDTLNMRAQMPHQLEMFGQYSEMIGDYTRAGLVPMPDTPEAHKLWGMVDPWLYRDKLTLPKCLLNGTNDPYWTVDALNLYWDDLKGDKYVMLVPNAGHDLVEKTGGKKDRSRATNGLAAFTRHQLTDKPLPKLKWKHDDADGKLRLSIESDVPAKAARLWVAKSPTADFRPAKWEAVPSQVAGTTFVGEAPRPTEGWQAVFGELQFEIDGIPYYLSTQIRVVKAGK